MARARRQPSSSTSSDPSRPDHYQRYDPEPITVIEAWGLGFHLGNVLKYVARAPHKGSELRDLRKARWYLDRWITVREAGLRGQKPPIPDDQT